MPACCAAVPILPNINDVHEYTKILQIAHGVLPVFEYLKQYVRLLASIQNMLTHYHFLCAAKSGSVTECDVTVARQWWKQGVRFADKPFAGAINALE